MKELYYYNDGYLTVESTEEKPTEGIKKFQMLVEPDTGEVYYFDGTEWQVFGGDD